jgi:PST family polysaccharide transporter
LRLTRPETVSQIFNAVMLAKTLLTGIGFIVMMAVVLATPRLRENWPLFPLGFLTVVGGLLFPMWLFQGLEKMGQVAVRDFVAKLLGTILVLFVVHHESDYLLAAGIQAGSTVVAGAISLAMVPAICKVRFRLLPWREVADVLRDGWPVFLSMAALTLTSTTNIVILGFVTSAAEVGYYVAAFRLTVALRMLVGPIVTALYPHISHMASKSTAGAMLFLRKYALVLAAPFLAISIILFVAAPLIVHILFGSKYEPTILVLRIMAFSPFLLALAHTYSTYYMLAFGYQKQWSRIILQSTVLNYVLMACLLWTIRPIHAMAIIGTALDVFTLAASYYFYRSNTRKESIAVGLTSSDASGNQIHG